MGFVLQNTVALTIVYILIVLYNKHRLVPFVSPFSYSCLCLTHAAADYVKCALC